MIHFTSTLLSRGLLSTNPPGYHLFCHVLQRLTCYDVTPSFQRMTHIHIRHALYIMRLERKFFFFFFLVVNTVQYEPSTPPWSYSVLPYILEICVQFCSLHLSTPWRILCHRLLLDICTVLFVVVAL